MAVLIYRGAAEKVERDIKVFNSGKFLGKCFINGHIHLETGLHIGSGKEVMEIGGLDYPVVRDPLTRVPYIPGSSLKGKMRALLERLEFAKKPESAWEAFFTREVSGGGRKLYHHECADINCIVCRLFGTIQGAGMHNNRPARLTVCDSFLDRKSLEKLEQVDTGLYLTELKFENTLDRLTAAASPRQVERVPKGSEFKFQLVYDQDEESERYEKDIEGMFTALNLLNDDALGGNTSRGYGRIKIHKLEWRKRSRAYYEKGSPEAETALQQEESETIMDFAKRINNYLKK